VLALLAPMRIHRHISTSEACDMEWKYAKA
jgi:hypothetical protein